MALIKDENNNIKCTYPQLFHEGEYYLDWTSFVEVSGLPSTNLYRIIKVLPDVPTIKYKNRTYYLTKWCFGFWRTVSNNNQ